MNTIKKIALFSVVILMQNKLSAQTQNNSSAQEVANKNTTPVNINSDVNHKSFTHISSGTTTIIKSLLPSNNLDLQNSSNEDLILPQVIDPKSMDTKPE